MIDAGAGAVEKLETALLPVGGFDDVALKVLRRKQARTGAGHEHAAGLEQRHGEKVEVLVFLAALPVAGEFAGEDKFRRVEHDDVPFLAVLLHLAGVGESIGVDEL